MDRRVDSMSSKNRHNVTRMLLAPHTQENLRQRVALLLKVCVSLGCVRCQIRNHFVLLGGASRQLRRSREAPGKH